MDFSTCSNECIDILDDNPADLLPIIFAIG